MSDPKPDVMQVDGGFVSAFACGPNCPCNEHGVEPQPDWRAEAESWRERYARLEAWVAMHPYGSCTCGGEGACGWCLRQESMEATYANTFQIAAKAPPFNERASDHGEVATASKLSPWGGYPLCLVCESTLTVEEVADGGVCEACQQVAR
jgi:hypothetical protein